MLQCRTNMQRNGAFYFMHNTYVNIKCTPTRYVTRTIYALLRASYKLY